MTSITFSLDSHEAIVPVHVDEKHTCLFQLFSPRNCCIKPKSTVRISIDVTSSFPASMTAEIIAIRNDFGYCRLFVLNELVKCGNTIHVTIFNTQDSAVIFDRGEKLTCIQLMKIETVKELNVKYHRSQASANEDMEGSEDSWSECW